MVEKSCSTHNPGLQVISLFCVTILCGCVPQQGDLKKIEQDFRQTSAKQVQLLSTLREHDLPQLRGELEKTLRLAQMFQARQEQIEVRLNRLEQQNGGDKSSLAQRLDSLDLVIGKILLRIEELEKRLQAREKR